MYICEKITNLIKMIIEFSVQNFRSIKEMQTLSMVAAPLKSKNSQLDKDNIIRVSDKLSLLKSAAIYGANGSGKSNLISGLSAMANVIEYSMKNDKVLKKIYQPFILDAQSSSRPTYFQLQFIADGKKYRYGFEFNNEKIISEWLFGQADKNEVYYFTRELNKIKINKSQFKEGGKLEDKTAPENLFLNVVAAFNGLITRTIREYIFSIGVYMNLHKGFEKITLDLIHKGREDDIVKLLNIADFGIESIHEEQLSEESYIYDIILKRKIPSSNGLSASTQDMSLFKNESEGTQKFFNITGVIILALEYGTPFIMDEFEASLHPILAKKIVEMFHSPKLNKKGAQLIFATHDTNLLDANLLRRDQIFFTEKNKKNETELYSLYDFKGVRNDASYEKDYIKGKYGAIPFVGDFETLFEEAV